MKSKRTVFFVDKEDEFEYSKEIRTIPITPLREGFVRVSVSYSSLNHMDARISKGGHSIKNCYPFVPGIDAAGTVTASDSEELLLGTKVLISSNLKYMGGFGDIIDIPERYITPLPEGLSAQEAMIIGTSGFTAAMAAELIIEQGITPSDGQILITGACSGIGIISALLLSKLGYCVVAHIKSKCAKKFALKHCSPALLTTAEVLDMDYYNKDQSGYAAIIDTIGGEVLENSLSLVKPKGVVALCDYYATPKIEMSLSPIIEREITFRGLNAANRTKQDRARLWNKLASEWKIDDLEKINRTITLDDLEDEIDKMLAGHYQGRVTIKID